MWHTLESLRETCKSLHLKFMLEFFTRLWLNCTMHHDAAHNHQVLRPTKHHQCEVVFLMLCCGCSVWTLCAGKMILNQSSALVSGGIHGHQTLAFYVSTRSSVGPEIEVALGLSSLRYDSCLYFPLHMYGILQRALLDVRMQPAGIHWMRVCRVFPRGDDDMFYATAGPDFSHYFFSFYYCVIFSAACAERERWAFLVPSALFWCIQASFTALNQMISNHKQDDRTEHWDIWNIATATALPSSCLSLSSCLAPWFCILSLLPTVWLWVLVGQGFSRQSYTENTERGGGGNWWIQYTSYWHFFFFFT